MPHRKAAVLIPLAALAAGCASPGGETRDGHEVKRSEANAHDQVVATERAFAKTMADRDFAAFKTFLSSEAIFFNANTVQHGPQAIERVWKPYFSGATAPFSWAPDNVEVLPSGKLALSTGPVFVDGKQVARYNSVWRLENGNSWRIVFDKGESVCSPGP